MDRLLPYLCSGRIPRAPAPAPCAAVTLGTAGIRRGRLHPLSGISRAAPRIPRCLIPGSHCNCTGEPQASAGCALRPLAARMCNLLSAISSSRHSILPWVLAPGLASLPSALLKRWFLNQC